VDHGKSDAKKVHSIAQKNFAIDLFATKVHYMVLLSYKEEMTKKHYYFKKTPEYNDWIVKETAKSRVQIADRLMNIEDYGHFGDHREDLGEGVCELKWKNGRRVYYAFIPEKNIVLLLGGNKNGQSKDIVKAKKIFKRYT